MDKDLLSVFLFNPEKDRTRAFTAVYEEGVYGFAYVKRFTFGGMINNKEYRLAPEKSKVLYFKDGLPERMYVKFKPAKSQRIHQQIFELGAPPTGEVEGEGLAVRGASSRGRQMTSKAIARLATEKPTWWDDSEEVSKGVLF